MLTGQKLKLIALALLLLFSSLPAFPSGKVQAADVQAEAAQDASYVRIQNQYTGAYLYALEDKVAYGSPVETDQASHWQIVQDGEKVKIQNRETGKWMAVSAAESHLEPVVLLDDEQVSQPQEAERIQWHLLNALTDGFFNVESAAKPQSYLHVEDGTGYAQASNIPLQWGSVQWKLEPVTTYMRLKNSYTGAYLMALHDKVSYSTDTAESNPAGHWVIEQQGEDVRLVNRSSGKAISRSGLQDHLSPLVLEELSEPAKAETQWKLVSAGEGLWNIQSSQQSDQLIHLEDSTGYAQASSIPANWGSAQWVQEEVKTKAPHVDNPDQEQPGYIRIQNDWLELYMYEDEGVLRYGNVSSSDERGHWQVEEHAGAYTLQNRATGHYISLNGITDDLTPVPLVEQVEVDDAILWHIANMQTAGNKHISAINEQGEIYLHVEKKLGYVQYGAIPAAWGSPQWRFIAVKDSGPSFIRLKNSYTGQYLYEQDGKVAYGEPALEDAASHWQLEALDNDQYRIINRATGHYIHIEGMASGENAHLAPLPAGEIESSWTSAKWTLLESGEGIINIVNVYQPDKLVHVEDGTGYAQASNIPSFWGSAGWIVEAAPEHMPIAIPEGYARLKNAATSQYLYENANGVILYGELAETDGRGHWLIEANPDTPQQYTITNRLSGKQIQYSTKDQLLVTVSPAAGEEQSYWWIEPAPTGSHALIRSTTAPLEYVHLRDRAGYAQQSLQSVEAADLHWSIEQASETVVPHSEESNSEPVYTSWIPHNQPFQLHGQGKQLLIKQEQIVLEESSATYAPDEAEWVLWDYNGYQWLQHKATGLFVYWNDELGRYESATQQQLGAEPDASLSWQLASGKGKLELTPYKAASVANASSASSAPQLSIVYTVADVTIQAEDAFVRGGLAVETLMARNAEGSGVVAGFTDQEQQLIFTVHASEDGTYKTALRYAFAGSGSKQLEAKVNGLAGGTVQLNSAASWDEWQTAQFELSLRQGLNTVVLSSVYSDKQPLWLDQLTVEQVLPLAYRGATAEAVVYEAELAATTGELLEPSRQYYSMAAESSARGAVKLVEAEDDITFEVQQAANRLTLRYILPDSEDGSGITAQYGLLINGKLVEQPVISSQYAWVYGSYPWSNRPADGNAHRFYDEHTIAIPEVKAGDVITIQKLNEQPYMIVDLIELALAPEAYEQPRGYVNAADYGVVAGDGQDDRAAIIEAIAAAQKLGYGVYIPAGQYEIAGEPIPVSNITIRGAGKWHTELIGYGFIGLGSDVEIYDLAIDGKRSARIDELEESGFDGTYGTGSILSHLRINRTKTGIWINQKELDSGEMLATTGLYVSDVQIRNTYADGINFSSGTSHSMAEHASIRYSGDDGLAMWANGTQSVGNTFRFNTVELPWLASNISIYGGKDVTVVDNIAADTIAFGAGISVSTRHNPERFEGTTLVARNTLLRTGGREHNWPADFGAMFIYTSDRPLDGSIVIQDNSIVDSTYQGISFLGEQPASGLLLERNSVERSGTWGIATSGNISGTAALGGTIVRDSRLGDLREGAAAFELKRLNQGYSFKDFDFYVTFNGVRQALFVLELGDTAELTAWTMAGDKLDSASIAVEGEAVAVQPAGSLQAVKAGSSVVTVTAGSSTRAYTVTVRDTDAPVWSTNAARLSASVQSASEIKLTLPEAVDASAVSYRLTWNGGYQLISGTEKEVLISGLRSGSSYQFMLDAVDESGNWSKDSLTATAATTGGAVVQPQPQPQPDSSFIVTERKDEQGQAVTAYQVTDSAWQQLLNHATGEGMLIRMPAEAAAKQAALELSAEQLQQLAAQQQLKSIAVQLGEVQYRLATRELANLLGQEVELIALYMSQAEQLPLTLPEMKPQSAFHSISVYVDGKQVDSAQQQLTLQVTAHLDGTKAEEAVVQQKWSVQYYDAAAKRYRYVPAVLTKQANGGWTVEIPQLYSSNWVVVEQARSFDDIQSHWAKQEIERLAAYGIINGKSDKRFAPEERVTRAEFAQLIVNALGMPGVGAARFTDVAEQDWYYAAASVAGELQIAQGYADGSFKPQAFITREQLVVMLVRTLRLVDPELAPMQADLSLYKDGDQVSTWAQADIETALAIGLLKGTTPDTLSPGGEATRAEAAILINRLIER